MHVRQYTHDSLREPLRRHPTLDPASRKLRAADQALFSPRRRNLPAYSLLSWVKLDEENCYDAAGGYRIEEDRVGDD